MNTIRSLVGLPPKPCPVDVVKKAIADSRAGKEERDKRHEDAAVKLENVARKTIDALRHENAGC